MWTLRGLKLILHCSACILLRRSEVEAEDKVGNIKKAKDKTDLRMRDESGKKMCKQQSI